MRQSFTTRNVMQRPEWMSLALVNGPFKRLEGLWTFTAIGASGTKVVLDMTFEFANPVASMLFGRAFEQSVGELIDAFVARARIKYASSGPSAPADSGPVDPTPDAGGG
jgi:ribosome-associated toxin RatA of RatAB toxin-antitoxin module